MSFHSTSHGLTSSIKWFFTASQSYLASASPDTKRNPLSATDAIGHEVVDATVKTTTGYVANILNPIGTALKNLGWIVLPENYRNNGIKTPFQWVWWVIANTGKAFANAITGISHAANHAVQHWVNNTIVEASNGTMNRIPIIGKFLGNIPKLGAGIVNAPFALTSWLAKKIPDRFMDWIAKPSLYKTSDRHLVWASHGASDHWHGGWHH
jgi:hypothetical protein